jgi:hypothetical protein
VLGSPGDVVQLSGNWVDTDPGTSGIQGTVFAGTDGQMFTQYTDIDNTAIIRIENEVKVQAVA